MMNKKDFISLVKRKAIKAVSRYDALMSERQEIMRKEVKCVRAIASLKNLIEYEEKEVR